MQTSSITPKDFIALGGPNLVYVREVSASEILADALSRFERRSPSRRNRRSMRCTAATASGLAVLADRDSAFAAALAHELAPVSVH